MEPRQAYEQQVQGRLEQIQAEIQRLQTRAREADADRGIAMEEEAAGLEARREAVLTRLALLRDAGEEALDEVKTGLEEALRDLEDALETATGKLQK